MNFVFVECFNGKVTNSTKELHGKIVCPDSRFLTQSIKYPSKCVLE